MFQTSACKYINTGPNWNLSKKLELELSKISNMDDDRERIFAYIDLVTTFKA